MCLMQGVRLLHDRWGLFHQYNNNAFCSLLFVTNANSTLHDTHLCNQSCPSQIKAEIFMTPICAINHAHYKCKQNSSWHPTVQSIMPITNANRILHDTHLCNQSFPSQMQTEFFMTPICAINHAYHKCKQNSSWHLSVQSIMPITNTSSNLHVTHFWNQSCLLLCWHYRLFS